MPSSSMSLCPISILSSHHPSPPLPPAAYDSLNRVSQTLSHTHLTVYICTSTQNTCTPRWDHPLQTLNLPSSLPLPSSLLSLPSAALTSTLTFCSLILTLSTTFHPSLTSASPDLLPLLPFKPTQPSTSLLLLGLSDFRRKLPCLAAGCFTSTAALSDRRIKREKIEQVWEWCVCLYRTVCVNTVCVHVLSEVWIRKFPPKNVKIDQCMTAGKGLLRNPFANCHMVTFYCLCWDLVLIQLLKSKAYLQYICDKKKMVHTFSSDLIRDASTPKLDSLKLASEKDCGENTKEKEIMTRRSVRLSCLCCSTNSLNPTSEQNGLRFKLVWNNAL